MKIFFIISSCIFLFIAGVFIRHILYFDRVTRYNSIQKNIVYAPNKKDYVEVKRFYCSLFLKQCNQVRVYFSAGFLEINADERNIYCSGKSLSTQLDSLPKIIWKDNNQVDIYVQTRVQFGTQIIRSGSFNIITHYERQD